MKLIPLKDLKPAAYNPRAVDPARLELVKLSLEKLGWLLPVYATADGEILSGHQRTHERSSQKKCLWPEYSGPLNCARLNPVRNYSASATSPDS